MKKFKITQGDRVYIVDAKSHIDAINKVKSVKDGTVRDSAIRDYSPEVYVKELEKLIPEYIKLDKLRDKIIESLKSSGKIDSSNWRQTDKYINDAKVQQWLKQVKELDTKWNKLLDNLSRFKGTQSYRRDTNSSDRDIWLDDVPYPREIKGIQGDIAIIGLLKGFKKNKDSISQWKPGMSEIGLFQISYTKGTVNQSILVKAATKEDAINKFIKHKPDAEVIGVNEYPNPHFGEPILDSKIKDEWSGIRSNGVIFNYSNGKYTITHKNGKVETFPGNKFNTAEELFKYIDNIKDSNIKDSNIKDGSIDYGTLTIDLNSPNELTSSKIVQELKNRIGNNKIAEIRGGSFISLREYGSASLELDFKEFRYNNWGTNSITLAVSYTVPAMYKALKNDPKYGAYKLRTELNNKLKQFANKTIYSNKSFTMDSAIKDMPLMFKSNVNMQSLKSNIDNVKNKPNETYINSLNANIQGIIADIEEIKGYEKEGKFNESPALKFSCKNLMAQYYKLLNDPKLQGTLHKLDESTYKNVLYAEHQAQMLSQVTLKDSAIKDSYGWSYIMAPMKTPGDKDLNLLSKLMSTYYDYIYQDVYNIRKAFAKTTNRRVAINMVKDTPEYQYFIKMLNMVDKDWNAVISKYPKLKKFNINTTGAERLLYGYYPTTKDFVDEITPVIKKEW